MTKTKMKRGVIALATTINAVLSFTPTHAQIDPNAVRPDSVSPTTTVDSTIKNVINILLFVVGAAAVIMLIIGAIRYVVSAGDQQAVAGAKNTIIYAIVGIVVAVMAFAIVNFVIGADGLGVTTE